MQWEQSSNDKVPSLRSERKNNNHGLHEHLDRRSQLHESTRIFRSAKPMVFRRLKTKGVAAREEKESLRENGGALNEVKFYKLIQPFSSRSEASNLTNYIRGLGNLNQICSIAHCVSRAKGLTSSS